MTKKMLGYGIVAASALAMTVPAFAADAIMEPAPQPPIAAPIEAPQFSWSGIYGGAAVGYGWASDSSARVDQPGGTPSDRNFTNADGITGGVFGGYQQQSGNIVYGLEADVDVSDYDDTRPAFTGGSATQEVGVQGSLRGRLGYALGRTMVYGTAGGAVADIETSATDRLGNSGGTDDARFGWTVGAGVEHAITDQMFVRGEYRYTDYGDETFDLGPAGGSATVDTNIHTAKVGVGFKF
jgi:outer membrane immunogenic protein